MIRTDFSAQKVFALQGAADLPRLVRAGSVLRVEVLAATPDNGVRIRLAGQTVLAANITGMRPGDSFLARVSISDSSVILHPIQNDSVGASDAFSRLGIEETPVNVFLVSFFQTIRARLDPRQIQNLQRLASRFPGKEILAAEAAAILAERGIEPDEKTVTRLMCAITGDRDSGDGHDGSGGHSGDGCESGAGGGQNAASNEREAPESGDKSNDGKEHAARSSASVDGTADGKAGSMNVAEPDSSIDTGFTAAAMNPSMRDFLGFINQKKGHDLHWIIVPFNTCLAGIPCSGSIRVLLDVATGKTCEMRLTCTAGTHFWEFDTAGKTCHFTAVPQYEAVTFNKCVVYLKRLLSKAGITDVSYYLNGDAFPSGLQTVNVEV